MRNCHVSAVEPYVVQLLCECRTLNGLAEWCRLLFTKRNDLVLLSSVLGKRLLGRFGM